MSSTQELINMLMKYGAMMNTPSAAPHVLHMRKYMDELPDRLGLPKSPSKLLKQDPSQAKTLTDLIARYTGVHPEDVAKSASNNELANAVHDYGDSGYRAINKIFRDPFSPSMSPERNMQATILMDSFKPTSNDMVVYRGLSPESKTANKINSMELNNSLNEMGNKSFMSTSLDPYIARGFAETGSARNNYRIMVPAGSPVLPVHGANTNLTPELEYMLPPDSRYARLPRDMSSNYTDLVLTKPGSMQAPDYVPDSPGVGWLAGLLPFGLLDKYSGDQQQ